MRTNGVDYSTYDIDLLYYISLLLQRWKALLVFAISGAVLFFLIGLFVPKTFESKATIYPQQDMKQSTLISSLTMLGKSPGSQSGYLVTILQSETMFRDVATELNLDEGGEVSLESVIDSLRKKVSIRQTRDGGIDVVVRASEPDLAANIANRIIDDLGSMVVTASRKKADFTAGKIEETLKDLKVAEDDLMKLQKTLKLADVDETTRSLIEQLMSVEEQLIAVNMELEGTISEAENSGDLKSLVGLEVKRKSLESRSAYLVGQKAELEKRINRLPSDAVEYARVKRKVMVLNKTYEILTEQHEMAVISQHGEDGDYQIIDRAVPRMKAVAPSKRKFAMGGALLGLVVSSSLVLFSKKKSK